MSFDYLIMIFNISLIFLLFELELLLNMIKLNLLLSIIFLLNKILTNFTKPSKNITFTLASNIILNPNISNPVISPSYYHDYTLNINGWATLGTFIEYIDICELKSQTFTGCSNYNGVTCGWQFLDVDSVYKN